jgi:hypothetical protein
VGIAAMLAMIAMASRAEILGLFEVVGASAILYLAQTRYLARKNAAAAPVHL